MLMKNGAIALTLAALVLGNLCCIARQSSQFLEEEIWKLEEGLRKNLDGANHDAFLSAYHEDFLGWPETATRPLRKTDLPEILQENYPEPSNNVVEFERVGIQLKEDIAITQFAIHITTLGEENEEIKQSTRVTHTWVKEADGWKVLGGMSNATN